VETLLTADISRAFPGRPESVPVARSWVASHLPGPPATSDVMLLTSELVTNAILHSRSGLAGGSFTVTVKVIPARIRVEVIDQGEVDEETEPARAFGRALAGETGHLGLSIVRQVAAGWGRNGPRRWFILNLGGVR
jgi:anti-sigma regulatory factor (Ser/Thr protein kinase)